MVIVFWTALALVFYCYVGYPALVALLAEIRPRPVAKSDMTPTVSVILSVWNEADVIAAKIQNLLSLDYPPDRIDFYVGSDCSTDGTDEIARRFQDPRIHFVAGRERRGKMLMINDLAAMTGHEIIVFTDARQIFEKNAVRQLVANFADDRVGCVSGELVFHGPSGETARGIDLYWTYEKFIRRQESRIHSMLGATGAVYAIRRSLFVPLPGDMVLDDMFIPFQVIGRGYRAVFDDTARAFDLVAENPGEEYRRKVRTLYGNYQIFKALPQMFHPLRSPIAVQLFSHKFLRLVVPLFLLAIFFANIALLRGGFYRMIFYPQAVFYTLAVFGWESRGKEHVTPKIILKVIRIPYVFCLLNAAALAGFWRFLAGKQKITWEKARQKDAV